ncbi:MAG: cytochrome c oxidase subunit 3, partial [Gammaproteobacteria bacterium]|nr:cytochrome c oxidase subunit 3 [Gammaproteobacteria bacterium]
MSAEARAANHYDIPNGTHWPIMGSVGLFTTALGGALWLEGVGFGGYLCLLGMIIILLMMFGWFGTVIRESISGTYNDQVDRSFRWGMTFFIFSEVM